MLDPFAVRWLDATRAEQAVTVRIADVGFSGVGFLDIPIRSRTAFMHGVIARISGFLKNEDGPTAVEYAVMLALILVTCISIVNALGTNVSGTFSRVNKSMKTGG